MSKFWKQILGILFLLCGVAALLFILFKRSDNHVDSVRKVRNDTITESIHHKKPNVKLEKPDSSLEIIPDYVSKTLEHILKYREAPPNYVGGRIFQNREKRLNSFNAKGDKIIYREWDVHPKIKGKNRGAERLVTGSDRSAYYTNDHYRTFIKIKP